MNFQSLKQARCLKMHLQRFLSIRSNSNSPQSIKEARESWNRQNSSNFFDVVFHSPLMTLGCATCHVFNPTQSIWAKRDAAGFIAAILGHPETPPLGGEICETNQQFTNLHRSTKSLLQETFGVCCSSTVICFAKKRWLHSRRGKGDFSVDLTKRLALGNALPSSLWFSHNDTFAFERSSVVLTNTNAIAILCGCEANGTRFVWCRFVERLGLEDKIRQINLWQILSVLVQAKCVTHLERLFAMLCTARMYRRRLKTFSRCAWSSIGADECTAASASNKEETSGPVRIQASKFMHLSRNG